MKKKVVGFMCVSLVLFVACLWATSVAAEQKQVETGKTVIAIHGDDYVDVNYHREKTGLMAGGLLGYAIGSTADGPTQKDMAKGKDKVKKFEDFLGDGGTAVKTNLTDLAGPTGKKLASKIK